MKIINSRFFLLFSNGYLVLSQSILVFLLSKIFNTYFVGVYFISQTIFQILLTVSRLGLDNGILKYRGFKQHEKLENVILTPYVIFLILNLAITIFLFVTNKFDWFNNDIEKMVLVLSFGLFFQNSFIFTISVFQSDQMFLQKALLQNILEPSLKILSLVILWILQVNYVISFGYSLLVISLIVALISTLLLNKHLKYGINKKINLTLIQESVPFMFLFFLTMVIQWTDNFMLSIFSTIKYTAIYNVSLKLAIFTTLSLLIGNILFSPKISALFYKNKVKELNKNYLDISRFITVGSTTIYIVLILFGTPILGLFGNEYRFGYISLLFLGLGQYSGTIFGNVGTILMMTGNSRYFLSTSVLISIINVVLNYIFIINMGGVGASIASAIAWVSLNIILYYFVTKKVGISLFRSKGYLFTSLISVGFILVGVTFHFFLPSLIFIPTIFLIIYLLINTKFILVFLKIKLNTES